VVQSALGAATLIARHPDVPIATRRQQVTSPGGTTAAALQVFEDGKLMSLIESAVKAAVERGKQLAQD
jgi:pyrroline-5-carboxylate reductase